MAFKPRSYRFTEDDIAALTELSRLWGNVKPLPDVDTLREAIRRCLDVERSKLAKDSRKKTAKHPA